MIKKEEKMTQTNAEISSFGPLLKAFRKRQRLTQHQLAQSLGMNRNAIGRWEQGDFLPASKTIVLELARSLRLNDQETRQLLEASLTALSPYWSVPFPRNPFFTGREELLQTLHAQLGSHQVVALTQSYALHGLGGIGKTQIALEYAYQHALDYHAVFWIGAETEEQLISSLLHIAEVLQLPERNNKEQQQVIAAVQRWLSTHNQWLVIFDNVEDLERVPRFLPAARSGAILVTTRSQTLGTLAQGVDLLPMEQEEGILFLLRRAKVLAPDATREDVQRLAMHMPAQHAAAAELVNVMGGLPLALDQAGAYLEATRCGVSAYLDLFHSRRTVLLQQRGEGVRDHPASVSTTFALAIAATTERHPTVGDLLRACALLQPDAIPEELFRQGAERLGPELEAVCRDELEWNRLLAVACSYSLLHRQPEEQTLSLHRLVQAVLLDTMTGAEQEQWSRRVIGALDAAFPEMQPEEPMPIVWQQCERLLPHTLRCLQRVMTASKFLTVASLAYKSAQYLYQRGLYEQIEPLYQRALSIWEQTLGPGHPQVASSLFGLAMHYVEQSRHEQAEPLFQRALSIWEQTLGPGHPQVAYSQHALATLYREQGKYEQAEPLFQQALYIQEQALGPEHPRIAYSLNGLAILYYEQSKYKQAESFYQRALSIWEQALGPEHPNVARAFHNLAIVYRELGKYDHAELLFQQSLSIWEQALGPEHPRIAYPLSGLADLKVEQGKYAQAEPLYQRALSIQEQYLGQHHPETAQTLHTLALFRQKQGNLSEAFSFAKRALSIRSQALGEFHSQTVATRTLLAQLEQELACADDQAVFTHGDTPSPAKNDALQPFLAACCELHPRAWCRSADLWKAYEYWVQEHGERFPLSRHAFTAQLKAHGCWADRTNKAPALLC